MGDHASVRSSLRWYVPVLIGALAIALPSGARGQDTRELARAEFLKGVRAVESGEYLRALFHYQKSNKLRAHPRTLFNLAAVADHLERYEEAFDAYQNFVATATDHEKDLLPEARRRLAELALKLEADLRLTSSPAGAAIYVDGSPQSIGRTPMNVRLPPGTHVLVLKADGHKPTTVNVKISPTLDHAKHVTMPPIASELRIRSNIRGALVDIDELPIGAAPDLDDRPLVREVIPGDHQILVSAADHQPLRQTVTSRKGERLDIEVSMKRPRSTVNKLAWISMCAAGVAIATIGGLTLGLPAVRDDDLEQALLSDGVMVAGALMCTGAIVGWVRTRPPASEARITRSRLP